MKIIKNIFKFLVVLILFPFSFIINKLTKPKFPLINISFIFYKFGAHIKTLSDVSKNSDDLLRETYLLFLARYFYICDERQVEPVRKVILDNIRLKNSSKILAEKIYNAVYATLNDNEQNALAHLFFGLPPISYVRNEHEIVGQKFTLAKYDLSIFIKNDKLYSNLQLSSGPDIILLPMLVAILFEYVFDNIQDYQKRENFIQAIIRMVISYEDSDSRDMKVFQEMPNIIIESMDTTEVSEDA